MLGCRHSLCVSCFIQMINRGLNECPLCRFNFNQQQEINDTESEIYTQGSNASQYEYNETIAESDYIGNVSFSVKGFIDY